MKNYALIALLGAALAAPQITSAQASAYRIAGTVWVTRAIIAPATTPAYTGTATFRQDGTLSGLPRDGHGSGLVAGVWEQTGLRDFTFTFAADVYDNAGNYVNTNFVSGAMHVNDDGVTATGTTSVEVVDTTGTVLFKQPSAAPSSFTAVRLAAGALPL